MSYRTIRIRKDTYQKLQAMRAEVVRRGLHIIPNELLTDAEEAREVTTSLVLDAALNALLGMVEENRVEASDEA